MPVSLDSSAHHLMITFVLSAAACCDYTSIVQLLINAGADLLAVNAEGKFIYEIFSILHSVNKNIYLTVCC